MNSYAHGYFNDSFSNYMLRQEPSSEGLTLTSKKREKLSAHIFIYDYSLVATNLIRNYSCGANGKAER